MNNNKASKDSCTNFDVMGRIIDLMNERGWSQNELAKRSGIPQSTVSSWFSNNITPNVASIESLCKAFNISLSQFFISDLSNPVELSETQQNVLQIIQKFTPEQLENLNLFLKSI